VIAKGQRTPFRMKEMLSLNCGSCLSDYTDLLK
jgi:hypothetical protein